MDDDPDVHPAPRWIQAIFALTVLGWLAVGGLGWWTTEQIWPTIAAGAAASVTAAGGLYYTACRTMFPRRLNRDTDLVDQIYLKAPELIVIVGVAVPAAVGAIVWSVSGDWRTVVTGCVVGTVLPAAIVSAWLTWRDDSGCLGTMAAIALAPLLGVPAGLLVALWGGSVELAWVLGGLGVAVLLLNLFFAVSANAGVLKS
ncbi:hypothetical protein [Nocardia cyriacigeorgica]|uniref:hypothetical protein n=1 Tax=Nocardia cyriacigeorgica TaxID=135487 RepID=UPI0018953F57|nr:hypothetical protein [Nocardia cyriacigeorgica]MBF6480210.1 hypothetical protein [Nocardia cyriacigeorgica]